ncbi:MAG: hypothetical protein AMXMBFR57_16630 [Acidimicrobiia bacterium]
MRNAFKGLMLRTVEHSVSAMLGVLPGRLRVMLAERAPMVRRLPYAKARVLIHVDSWIGLNIRLRSAEREPGTVRWIEEHFAAGDVFYDIGANVGAYSLVAAVLHSGKVRVCAFEPSAFNFAQLVRNLALNHCGDTVIPLPVALADRTQPLVFNYRNVTSGAALHSLGDPVDEQQDVFVPALRQHVLAYSLDSIIPHYRLPAPTHIKIDVDGAEERVLAGASQVLASPTLKTVLIEAGPDATLNARVTTRLESAGLNIIQVQPMPGGFSNLLFGRQGAILAKNTIP